MQVEMKAEETALHIVDEFTIPEQPQLFIKSLCGQDIAMSEVKTSSYVVNWRLRTYPVERVCASKNLCADCVEECKRDWYHMMRRHKIPPDSIFICKNILTTIRNDIARTDDLEVLANLAKELQATSNRFYKKTAPALLYKQQKGRCALCQERQRNPKNMALDHIAPRAKGGSSSLDNLQLACRACNEEKGDRDNEWFINRLKEMGRIVDPSNENE